MKPIVIKTGSNVLTTESGRLDLNNVRYLTDQIAAVLKRGVPVIWVSSGAITCGSQRLGLKPESTEEKQAAAAVGQIVLMSEYSRFMEPKGIHIAQILVTRDGLQDPRRAEYTQNTMRTLLTQAVLPVVNENDTIAVEEICFGDNDELSAMVAILMQASKLILLTNQEGLFNSDPDENPNAILIQEVDKVTRDIETFVSQTFSKHGRGGMSSKIQAARAATEAGIEVYVAHGRERDVILKILDGARLGTHFKAQRIDASARAH